MKRSMLLTFLLVAILQGYSQEAASYTFTDITLAKAYAKKQNTPILMVFAGSDWCKPCIQFKKSILTSESFATYAKTNLTVLYLDFPLKKANKLSSEETAHNEKLAETYNSSGAFPAILLLDAEENMLSKLTFSNQSPETFISAIESLTN